MHTNSGLEKLCAPAKNAKNSSGLFSCFGRNKNGSKVCRQGKQAVHMVHRAVACPRCEPSAYTIAEINEFRPSKYDRFDNPSAVQSHMEEGPNGRSTRAPALAKPPPAVVRGSASSSTAAAVHTAPPRQPVQRRAPPSSSSTRHAGKPAPSRHQQSSSTPHGGSSHGGRSSSRSMGSPRAPAGSSAAGSRAEGGRWGSPTGRPVGPSTSAPQAVRGSVYDPQVAQQMFLLPGHFGESGSRPEGREDRFQPKDLHIPTYERDGYGCFVTDLRGRDMYTGPPSPTSTVGGAEWREYQAQLDKAKQFGIANNIYRGDGFR